MTIQSIIRPFHPNDVEAYYAIVSDPATLETYAGVPVLEIGAAQSWAKSPPTGLHRLVVEQDGTAVGFGMLQHIQRPRRIHSAELEWVIDPRRSREEYIRQLLTALVDLADRWLNLRRVEVQLISGDEVGLRLAEELGFEQEGVNEMAIFSSGRFHDLIVLSRVRDYVRPPAIEIPRPPRPQSDPPHIIIRPMKPEDAADLHDLYRNPAVARTTNQLPSQEYSVVAERTSHYEPGLYRLVAEVGGRVIGNITLHRSNNPRMSHSGDFGMAIHPDYWSQGVGTRLLGAMIETADNWINLHRIGLEVHPDNVAAVRLYKKYGFKMEGTRRLYNYGDGRWIDAHFMARLRPF